MKKIFLTVLIFNLLLFSNMVFAETFIYTDDSAKVKFEIDESIWIEKDLSKEREHILNKWESDFGILMYSTTDAYSSFSYEELNGLSRKEFNDAIIDNDFAREYVEGYSQNFSIDEWMIQNYKMKFIDFYGSTNLNGINTGFDFFSTINNGYLIIFQYYGDGSNESITQVENVIKSVQSTFPKSIPLANSTKSTDSSNSENNESLLLKNIIFSIFMTLICYMTFPIVKLIINKGKFDKKRAKRIALWNSIVVGGIFMILTIESGAQWSGGAAFLYYFINKTILTNKNIESNENLILNTIKGENESKKKYETMQVYLSDSDEDVPYQYGRTKMEDIRIQKSEDDEKGNIVIPKNSDT